MTKKKASLEDFLEMKSDALHRVDSDRNKAEKVIVNKEKEVQTKKNIVASVVTGKNVTEKHDKKNKKKDKHKKKQPYIAKAVESQKKEAPQKEAPKSTVKEIATVSPVKLQEKVFGKGAAAEMKEVLLNQFKTNEVKAPEAAKVEETPKEEIAAIEEPVKETVAEVTPEPTPTPVEDVAAEKKVEEKTETVAATTNETEATPVEEVSEVVAEPNIPAVEAKVESE